MAYLRHISYLFEICVSTDDSADLTTIHEAYQWLMKTYVADDDDSKALENSKDKKIHRITKNNATPMIPLVENLIIPPSPSVKKKIKKGMIVDFTKNSFEDKKCLEDDKNGDSRQSSPEMMLQEIENLIENLNFHEQPISSSSLYSKTKNKENAKKRRYQVLP